MKQIKPKPIQAELITDNAIQANDLPPLMLVNCSELSRILKVSRATVARYKKAGFIVLNDDGLINPRDAMKSIIDSTDHDRMKTPFLKSQIDTTSELKSENNLLKAKLIELESALTLCRADSDMWQRDYWGTHETVTAFIEQLTTDNELQQAAKEGNGAILQNAFDDLLEN
jgi:hypothetical protein